MVTKQLSLLVAVAVAVLLKMLRLSWGGFTHAQKQEHFASEP